MEYKYDYYVAYAALPENASEILDPQFVKDYNGFVDAFVSKLENSSEFQTAFGRKARVYCCRRLVKSVEDWDCNNYPEMASSRCMIILLSPLYFRNSLFGYEFMRWMERETYTRVMGNSVIPMYMFGYGPDHGNFLQDVPDYVFEALPFASTWAEYLNVITLDEPFDMHNFQASKINNSLHSLINYTRSLFEKQDRSEVVPCNNGYPTMSDHYFTQHKKLYEIREVFDNPRTKKSVTLYGLDGGGKTETALAYGYAYAWDYELGRIFISCEKKASIKSVLLASGIAELFGWDVPAGTLDEQFAFLLQKLQQKHDEYIKQNPPLDGEESLSYGGNMLLILDNVNQLELVSENNLGLLPDFIHVIVTTRKTTFQYKHLVNLPISPLSKEDALDLLKSYRPFVSEEDVQCAQNIVNHFYGFPAPLAQTGFYLQKNPQISYSEFYSRLTCFYAGTLQAIASFSSLSSNQLEKSVMDSMKKAYDKLSPNAQMFLEFAEVVSYIAIPVPWIRDCWGIDEKQFEDAVEELKEYNILSFEEDKPHLGMVNPVIMRYKMRSEEPLVVEKIPMLFDRSSQTLENDFAYWASGEQLWELEAIDGIYTRYMNNVDDIQKAVDLGLPDKFLRIGQIYKDLKIYDKANQIFIKNAELCHDILDAFPDDIPTLKFLSNSYQRLGNIAYNNGSGDVNEARQWFEAMLEIDERIAANEPVDLVSQVNLAIAYVGMSDIEKSMENYDNAFEWLQKALIQAKDAEKRFSSNENLSGAFSDIYGRIADLERQKNHADKAREWYHKAREIDERLAEQAPNNVKKLENLAIIYQNIASLEFELSNFNEAVEWFKKSLAVRKQVVELVPNDMIVQEPIYNTYSNIAKAELNAGNVNNAEMYREKELAVIRSLIESYPDEVSLKNDSGYAYLELGDLNVNKGNVQNARQLYQEATRDFESVLSIQSDEQNAQFGLALAYDKLGDLSADVGNVDDAIQFLQYEAAILNRVWEGNYNNDSLMYMYGETFAKLGVLHSAVNNYNLAKESMTIAIQVLSDLVQRQPSNTNLLEEVESYRRFMKDFDNKQNPSKGFFGNLFDKFFGK